MLTKPQELPAAAEEEEIPSAVFDLPRRSELRLSVPRGEAFYSASVTLVRQEGDRHVECLGAPLASDVRYWLSPGESFSIWSWTTAKLMFTGSERFLRSIYRPAQGDDTRAMAAAELHSLLHIDRLKAKSRGAIGPCVLVVGSRGVGKHSVARTLLNYAARLGWCPTFVDLDPSASQRVAVPGAIGATIVEHPTAIDDTLLGSGVSLHFFVGSLSAQRVDLTYHSQRSIDPAFRHASKQLLKVTQERLHTHSAAPSGASGCVVVCPELCGMDGVRMLHEWIHESLPSASNVVSIGDDFLFHHLSRLLRTNAAAPERFDGRTHTTLHGTKLHLDRLSPSKGVRCAVSASAQARQRNFCYERYLHHHGAQGFVVNPLLHVRRHQDLDAYVVECQDDRPTAAAVERVRLPSLRGLLGAIVDAKGLSGGSSILEANVIAYCRLDDVDGDEVHLRTTVNDLPRGNKSIRVLFGSVVWGVE